MAKTDRDFEYQNMKADRDYWRNRAEDAEERAAEYQLKAQPEYINQQVDKILKEEQQRLEGLKTQHAAYVGFISELQDFVDRDDLHNIIRQSGSQSMRVLILELFKSKTTLGETIEVAHDDDIPL